ncbi:MAG: hypothetical protein SVR94_15240, partial [Pseudomonadota bacterium]|nr:hypothetical protein [Pseudomonadota bacterium]
MTMTFIRFAEEQQVNAYQTGRWSGAFLSRYVEEPFTPKQFRAWMEEELALYDVPYEVSEQSAKRVTFTRDRF